MTKKEKTTYSVVASLRVQAISGYRYSNIINADRACEVDALDGIPGAAFRSAEGAVRGALIGMGVSPALIGLQPRLGDGLPEDWEVALKNAHHILDRAGWDGGAQGVRRVLDTLRRRLGITEPDA